MEKFRILIVEDNDAYRKSLRDALQKSFPEIAIDEATNGREALQKVDPFPPNLIFMDIRLHDEKNGLELTKEIKTTHPNIHVVILTYCDMPEYRTAASEYGVEGFLVKASLGQKELEELVKSYQKV